MVSVPYFPGMNASHLRSSFPINGIPAQSHIYPITDSKLWDALLKNPDDVKAFLKTNPPRVINSVAPLEASTCFVAAPVAAAGAGAAAPVTEERMRAILKEEREGKTVHISKAEATDMLALIADAGVDTTETQDPPVYEPSFLPAFRPFDWHDREAAYTPEACRRLNEYLIQAEVPMNANPGFKIVDVHGSDILNSTVGRFKLRGRTDLMIIPTGQSATVPQQQGRVIIELKVKCGSVATEQGQVLAEFVAASALSRHDIMAVVTDLNEKAHIWRAEGSTLLVWENCTIKQAIKVMAEFLINMCARQGVHDPESEHVPGAPEAKRRRKEFHDSLKKLTPANDLLRDQLEAFAGQGFEGWMASRELVFSAMERDNSSFMSLYA